MRIAISTTGSDGDVLPFLTLARALERAGHTVWLVAPGEYLEAARGLRLFETGTPPRRVAAQGPLPDSPNPVERMRIRAVDFADTLLPTVGNVVEAVRGADLVVHHHMDLPAYAAATVHRLPRISGWIAGIPWVELSPRPERSVRAIYRAYDRGYWWLQYRIANRHLNSVLEAAGLPPKRDVTAELFRADRVLLAVSPTVAPRRRSWPDQLELTGFWYEESPSYSPSDELLRFLDAGEPPVVACFGSTQLAEPRRWSEALVSGILSAGRRAIVVGGHAALDAAGRGENVFWAPRIPFDWLFERASAALHHGGAGTTALALRAGIPQAVAWHVSDQPRWAATVHRLGVGARPCKPRNFSARWVRDATIACTEDVRLIEAARGLGEVIRKENGVSSAVRSIVRFARSRGLT